MRFGFVPAARFPLIPGCFLLLAASLLGSTASFAAHQHVSPDGRTLAVCACRPATAAERTDLSLAPDGWVQDEPRASFSNGTVPFPLVPDWVGSRERAIGSLAFGDADGDGDLDLAVGTYWGNMYPPIPDYYNFIYLNNGGALETSPSWISSDQKHTCDLAWGYINNDAWLDLFVANGGESKQPCQVFYGRAGLLPATAGWQSNIDCWTLGCALGDFDHDGDLDCALANEGNSVIPYRPVYLLLNNGNGLAMTPSWGSSLSGIWQSVDWADMDGDGYADLAVAGWVGWPTGVFRNTHTSLEYDMTWTTGHPDRTDGSARWADYDRDGHPDLAVGGNGAPDWLFRNEGSRLGVNPVWASGESYHGVEDMAWADVNNDGWPDLATINFSNGHVRIYLNNNGTLSSSADWVYDCASSGTTLTFGDVDADGDQDLAIGVANGPVMLFYNTGAPAGVPQSAAELPRTGEVRLLAGVSPGGARVEFTAESAVPFRLDGIEVYDLHGRRVASVAARSPAGSGRAARTQTATWNSGAARLGSGIYFARAIGTTESGRRVAARTKVALLKD